MFHVHALTADRFTFNGVRNIAILEEEQTAASQEYRWQEQLAFPASSKMLAADA
jgi:hypothetical protein